MASFGFSVHYTASRSFFILSVLFPLMKLFSLQDTILGLPGINSTRETVISLADFFINFGFY